MRLLPLGLLLTAGFLALGMAGSSAPMAKDNQSRADRLAFGFMETVFGTEYDKGWWFSGANRVKKYTVPVRFYVHNRSRKDRRRETERFLRGLSDRIPGFSGSIAPSYRDANFHVFIVDRKDFQSTVTRDAGLAAQAAHNAECLVHIWFDRRGITESRAVIVSDRGERLFNRCLVEEVLQGLGPINDSPHLHESVFNDYSRHSSLTSFDRSLLQMLYHPAIKPGMGRKDVARLLPEVISDLRLAR